MEAIFTFLFKAIVTVGGLCAAAAFIIAGIVFLIQFVICSFTGFDKFFSVWGDEDDSSTQKD